MKMHLLMLCSFLFLRTLCSAQEDSFQVERQVPVRVQERRPPVVASLVLSELFIVGTSYLAAHRRVYGDRVVGWLYAGSAAALLIELPFAWAHERDGTPGDKKRRIVNAVTMLGLSYGLSRVAVYNLLQAEQDPFSTRFKRNLLESHAAFIVPIAAGLLLERLLAGKKGKKKGVSFGATPSGAGVAFHFR